MAEIKNPVTIIKGGEPTPTGDVVLSLFDCYGNVIAEYDYDKAMALTEFPEAPEHDGLIFTEYNWTLEEAQEEISKGFNCDVGALYASSDGTFQIHISLNNPALLSPVLHIGIFGTVEIDWGDGTDAERYTKNQSTASSKYPHTYTSIGDYVIHIRTISGTWHGGYDTARYCLLDSLDYDGSYYRYQIKKMVGDNYPHHQNSFHDFHNFAVNTSAEYIILPKSRAGSLEGNKLKFFVYPRDAGSATYFGSRNNGAELSKSLKQVVLRGGSYSLPPYPNAILGFCTSIQRINLPSTLTGTISTSAFHSCSSLALTALPAGITSIGDYAFQNCSSLALTALPAGITSIAASAFSNCSSLALTALPAGITSIGKSAFQNCSSLALTALPAGITSIGTSAFQNCSSLALTALPAGLTSISNSAFQNCSSLALTALPAGLTSIGSSAFQNCNGLTSLIFEGTPATIANNAFSGCSNLTQIRVPWSESEVANAPWGATNATITYNYVGE